MKNHVFVAVYLFMLLLLQGCFSTENRLNELDLKKFTWNLHDEKDSINLESVDPSDVHLALFSKGIIPDPFYGDNEKKLQWIGERNWVFSTRFDLPAGFETNRKLILTAEGLDTYATVLLNEREILKSGNMFRQWKADVTGILKKSGNNLEIRFVSPVSVNKAKEKESPVPLPEVRGFTRKAAYQSGWDWGPRFVTMGVWKDLKIVARKYPEISDVYVRTLSVSKEKAVLITTTTVLSDKKDRYTVTILIDNLLHRSKEILLKAGTNTVNDTLIVKNPRLWWPAGMGKQPLYTIAAGIYDGEKLLDQKEVTTGIRKMELVNRKDDYGRSFYFRVNGKRLFARGANYIPQDNFLVRVDDSRYRKLLVTAQQSHINMLRVWGGGIYEKDIFYRLCDSLGILVWQDFMFAGNMVPVDTAFSNNVAKEVEEQIVRLRNHPSLTLWCGNNEVEEAWVNWGWQRQLGLTSADSTLLWNSYLRIFDTIIPGKIKALSPGIPYWRSSPSIGWGHKEAFREGDVHYWGVWWGKEPFEAYETHVGRFMSEYGFQGMPPVTSFRKFCPDTALYLCSEALKTHQKHPFGWENIGLYMRRDYHVPSSFGDYDYVSQLLQAEGIGKAIEAHRRAKPRCMGTLYWQLNDCWPVVSWSSVDYYGSWKALQYKVRSLYKPVILSFEKRKRKQTLYLVSDSTDGFKGTVFVRVMDVDGKVYFSKKTELFVKPDTAFKVLDINNIKDIDTTKTFLVAELSSGGKKLYRTFSYYTKPKNMKLPDPQIKKRIELKEDYALLTLTTGKFAKSVYIQSDTAGHWEDNFFNMLPFENRTIRFYPGSMPLKKMKVFVQTVAGIK